MATIKYTTYRFNKPPLITNGEYEILKEILTQKPEYNIEPPSNFVETFKYEFILLGIGGVGFLIVLLKIDALFWVGGIPAILAFFSLFGLIPSIFSYLGFLSDKGNYYLDLKKDIIKSNNYTEFIKLRNNKK
jgi:hypothetical protein